jgi:hypothetical protein
LMRTGERTHIQLVPRDAVEPEVYRILRADLKIIIDKVTQ